MSRRGRTAHENLCRPDCRHVYSQAPVKEEWWSYDPIAAAYARVAEDAYFARPARDLVSRLHLVPGSRLLDVGTGTGAVAALAADIVGSAGLVVGVDPAIGMLRRCRASRGVQIKVVAGEVPRLPCPEASFDAVTAAFVLTHVPDYAGALRAMVDVLRVGGRLGIAVWSRGPGRTPPGETWQTAVKEFVNDDDLRTAVQTALPWEEHFADPAFLEAALAASGVADIVVREVRYAVDMSTQAFIDSRLLTLPSRFMQVTLAAEAWARFTDEVSQRVVRTFGERVQFDVAVNLGLGTRRAVAVTDASAWADA